MTSSVCTLYELQEGDETEGESFHGLPTAVLMAALRVLDGDGRAALVEGRDISELGIKFK